MKRLSLLYSTLCLALVGCVSDDTDFSDLINSGGEPEQIVPKEINLNTSELVEADDVPPSDITNPYYDDYIEHGEIIYTVNIVFNGNTATLSGATRRVSISTNGAHVTIRSTAKHMNYVLQGSTPDGSLKIYGDNKAAVTLDGVDITNPNGAAVNNQCGKTLFLVLADGTVNRLVDGSAYSFTTGEDMKATLFSEGQIVFSGKGTLNVEANAQNGIASDDYIRFRPGCKINVNNIASHGIKANDGILIDGGVINVMTTGDGAKGINCDKHIEINGGRTTAITTGNATVRYDAVTALPDTVSCAALRCDSTLTVNAGTLNLKSTGDGGKGINATMAVTITGGEVNVVTTGTQTLATPKAIKCDDDINITGGSVYAYSAVGKSIEAAGNLNLALNYTQLTQSPILFIVSYLTE